MRIVFIGATGFGLRVAEAIFKLNECHLVGIVTAPRNFSISYNSSGVENVLHADLAGFASYIDVPCAVISNGMSDPSVFDLVKSWEPDCFVVVGWYHMLPKAWRAIAPAYGLHASVLPDYSGGAPLVWAIINGEKSTGITLFQFDDGVDSGPIIGWRTTKIEFEDTIASLYGRIEDIGIDLIVSYVPLLANGYKEFIVQDERKRRVFRQRSPDDGLIDWNQSAIEIYNFIRAQTRPYPGAFSTIGGVKVSIWSAKPCEVQFLSLKPKQIHYWNGDVYVGCGYNSVIKLDSISVGGSSIGMIEWSTTLFAWGSSSRVFFD